MPVDLLTEKLQIEPNRIFIIPENRDLHVLHGEFHLKPISKPRGWPDVITVFLRSLTLHGDGKLVAVIVFTVPAEGVAAGAVTQREEQGHGFTGVDDIVGRAGAAFGQEQPGLTVPAGGNGVSQRAEVSQWVGPVKISIAYHSPAVHRRGAEFDAGSLPLRRELPRVAKEIVEHHREQARRLRAEGVTVKEGRVAREAMTNLE